MKEVKIFYSPTFAKNFHKLPQTIKKKAYQKEKAFRQNIFTSALKTHKLSGKLHNYWSFSIDYQYRIVFRLVKENEILFVDVGTHEVYKK